ncbi:MAG: spermidine/putrescine ABC transporter permease [Spirochaetes bacterium GWD1_27_9]|nr:MAG: spermidine/putrescine ABC transporter permease [Spirochaetes bacterium GWC1_27_15]OHD30225.1 MAG: spermidine/putrescine ABC transporter permease [Spirochaetes bacterium GWD1_27_9]
MNRILNLIPTKKASFYFFIITMLFFYAPLFILIVFSFNSSKNISWAGFSLKWYKELFFNSSSLWNSFGNTIIVALTSAIVSTVIGTLGAIGIYWYKFKFKKYIEIVSYLPLILPEIIIGVSLLIFFSGIKLQLGLFTIFLAHVTFNLPYVLLIVMARLSEFDYSILEAAYDLGAREIDTLLKVIIPMSLPGIISGFLIAVTLSLDDFVITFFVTGPGSSTLPLHIYSMIRFGVSPVINALSVVLIAGSIILAISSKGLYKYMFSK